MMYSSCGVSILASPAADARGGEVTTSPSRGEAGPRFSCVKPATTWQVPIIFGEHMHDGASLRAAFTRRWTEELRFAVMRKHQALRVADVLVLSLRHNKSKLKEIRTDFEDIVVSFSPKTFVCWQCKWYCHVGVLDKNKVLSGEVVMSCDVTLLR